MKGWRDRHLPEVKALLGTFQPEIRSPSPAMCYGNSTLGGAQTHRYRVWAQSHRTTARRQAPSRETEP
jgi:hypothetical protein